MQHDSSSPLASSGTTFSSPDSLVWVADTRCPTCDWGFAPETDEQRELAWNTPETRHTDSMRPPSVSTDVECLHCGKVTSSAAMHWAPETAEGTRRRKLLEAKDAGKSCSTCGWTPRPAHRGDEHGHWLCGTPGCAGAGFGFDLHPVDPNFVDPDGRDMGSWVECDEDDFDNEEEHDAHDHSPRATREDEEKGCL